MLTRREILERGAAGGLAVLLGGVRSARAASDTTATASYLSRASWVPLAGATVATAGVTLRVAQVADLPQLAGRDDAFRLELSGAPGALASGTYPFQHAALGSFELFVSPVDTVTGGVQGYEVVVDRSVGVPRSFPKAPSTAPSTGTASVLGSRPATGSGMHAPLRHHRRRKRRRARLARRRHRLRVLRRKR